MQQQQPGESHFVSALLLRFEQDQSEATRDLLEKICSSDDHRSDYLRTFNLLLNSRSSHARQRRDVAAIARLIADSTIFAVLEPMLTQEAQQGQSCDPQSLTVELTKLIANICNQNPHFVDNILAANASILATLCALYSSPQTTPTDPDCITAVLNFLHNIALKETPLRSERVAPCLEAFLENLLTHSKFCPFISQKRFQTFVSSLFKFHANVPLVALGVYTALIKAARALNEQYKRLAQTYKGLSQRSSSPIERASIIERAGYADKKLIAMMRLFQKARSNIFSKFDAFSFTSLLKIFVKIAIMRPIALLNQPMENKLLITIINELMVTIQDYKEHVQANRILTVTHSHPQNESNIQLEDGEDGEPLPPIEQEVLPPIQGEKASFTPSQIERFRNELKSFDSICQVTRHFSQTYFKIIKSTIQTLTVSFECIGKLKDSQKQPATEAIDSCRFLIGVLTVRLQRILCMMLKLFPQEELTRGTYYKQIVSLLLNLLPSYFQSAIEAQSKAILEELPNMEDIATESEGSQMRYIMEAIDEQSVKTFIQGKLLEKINIFSTIYEVILKFVYHLVDDEAILRENMSNFVHVFIGELREKHLNAITNSPILTLRQIQTLRLALRIVTQLFHNNVNTSIDQQLKNRAKLYRYCHLLTQAGGENGLFCLLADILNNLQKHNIQRTIEITDTLQHRQQVAKTIFAKIIIQRAKTYVNLLTFAHNSRAQPKIEEGEGEIEAEAAYFRFIYQGYFAYLQVMNDFIRRTCGSHRFILFKEEILGNAISRTLDYGLFVRVEANEEGQKLELQLMREMKGRVDNACSQLAEWMLSNAHQRLHRLPLLTRKVLHFDKVGLSIRLGDAALFHQEQLAHIQNFIHQLSRLLNRCSLTLTGRKLDIRMKLKRESAMEGEEDINIEHEVQKIANGIVILGEAVKLLTSEQYLDDPHLHIAPNYLYSLLTLITTVLQTYAAQEHFPLQADDLIHGSLWLIETYLHYDSHIREFRRGKAEEKRRVKKEARKEVIKYKKRREKRREKRMRTEQSEEIPQNQQILIQQEQSKQQNEQDHGVQYHQREEELILPLKKRKRRRNRKKNKKSKQSREQQKILSKSGSKSNLFEQSQVRTEQKNHQKSKKQSKDRQNSLQKSIRDYLHFITSFLGNCSVPLIKNDTLSYMLNFISRHMHRSIIQAPPYLNFQVSLSDLTPHLLNIKVKDSRIPGYHFSLCKLGLQLFDDCHIKVDYELAIKRYIYQQGQAEITLQQFIKMLRENFKQVTQSTSNFVDIAVHEEGRTVRVPFQKNKYDELLVDKSKKCTIQLREGVQLHLLSTRPDPSTTRRKSSSGNQQQKQIKVSDYCPQGQLFTFIEHIITHSLKLLFFQIDRNITVGPSGKNSYETAMQPFTIRSILQTLQYLVRESPSLGPFIAKFKCKKILLAEMNNESLKHREQVVALAMRSLTGAAQNSQHLQQVGYLSVLIRLFSPLVVNAISGLIFQLCLDSTPLVQVQQGKQGKPSNKGNHVPFASVIRLKITEELANIMFEEVQLEWLYRKLCLLNLITVLINIREMARLFLQNSFISKLYKQFQAVKAQLGHVWERRGGQLPQPIPGNYITRIVSPFYLAPLSILQELNISFHYNKKLNKNAQKVSISTVLNRQSINAQLIPPDSLKRFKFKIDWPFHLRRDGNPLEAAQPEQQEEFFADHDISSQSEQLSEQDESIDSENSSFMRYEDLDMPMPDDDEMQSYMSMDQPHEQLLNQQWDYSDDQHQAGEEIMSPEYPSEADHVIQLGENIELQQDDEGEEDDEVDDGEEEIDEQAEAQADRQIQEYLQQQGMSDASHQDMNGESLIDELNGLPSEAPSSFTHHQLQVHRQFTLNTVNEQDYYISVNALLNFEKVQSIPRISKAEKRQVHLLRFFLQLTIFPQRLQFNTEHPRLKTVHETKEESQVQQNLSLTTALSKDEHLRIAESVQYNQIYRYDHYHKETPRLAEQIERQFTDHIQVVRRHNDRRRGGFIARDNLIQIMPGWNITEVVHQPAQHSESLPIDHDIGEPEEEESNSHMEIDSQSDDEGEGDDEGLMAQEDADMQQIDIQQLLRAANIAMTANQFRRLDMETQQDILMNIAHGHRQQEQQQLNVTPRNSPVSFVEPADQDAVQIPNLQIRSRDEPLSQGRVIQALSDRQSPSQEPEGPEPQLEQMQAEGEAEVNDQAEVNGEAMEGEGQPVDEVYRKMSLQHSKKISKDVIEALNKDGKNNTKFHQISYTQLEHLLQIFFITSDAEHSKYPYPLIESLCINTVTLKRLSSSLIALLHLTPAKFKPKAGQAVIRLPSCGSQQEQVIDYTLRAYPSLALKVLHLLTHLTKNYSIAMALLKPNNDLPPSLAHLCRPQQSALSSFQMLILLLRDKAVSECPRVLGFLIGVLDNITMHHFYKNVHKIVEKAGEEEQRVRINEDSVYLLGELLQSDFVSDNLPLVSKIIMRLSIEEHNLRNFIDYLQQLVRQLTDQALAEVTSQQTKPESIEKNETHPLLKIVNLMSIFYQMVKAFQTYPTSLDRHDQVMHSLRRIVQYEKLQELCERAVRGVFNFNSDGRASNRAAQVIDCFFVLYQIATVTGNRNNNKDQQQDEHNHIAELGQLDLAEQRRVLTAEEQQLWLGKFNLSVLWREAVAHPNFKLYVNGNIRRKIAQGTRRGSAFQLPIVKIAAATPHLLSFDNKYALFKNQLKRLRGRAKYEPIHIYLRRVDVFEASFEHLMTRSGQKLRGKVKIQFQGEEGEDAGGITREWFQLLSRQMFNPNYGLFRSGSAGHTYHPSSTSYFNERHLDYFKFIGRIAGKALSDGYLLDAYFTPAFYKHILALPITFRDMEQQDYQYFKSLSWMLQNSPIEDYLQLTFTYDCDNFGEIQTKELVVNGANIPVVEQNKLQYVQLIAYAKMATSIKPQLQAFLTGLHQLVPHRLLRIFSQKQLEIMISGRPTIDIQDLRRNTELVNYMRNDPIIVWLFEVLQSFDMELRTAFIQFVTGSSRVPVEGFKDLRGMNGVQRFNIHREFQEERLPRAHTCFNQLDLPNYKSKEILIEKLMYAITEGKEGFGMI